MMRDELVQELAAIEQMLDNRVTIVRVVIDEKGNELQRIYRGRFQRPRGNDPHHTQEDRT